MNNDELKKKIAKIIDTTGKPCNCLTVSECLAKTGCKYHNRNDGTTCFSHARAEALIAAGIGDVKEAEHRAQVAERALRIVAKEIPCDEWCPFSQKCNVELNGENGYQCCFDEYLRQAEKELAEERKDD